MLLLWDLAGLGCRPVEASPALLRVEEEGGLTGGVQIDAIALRARE